MGAIVLASIVILFIFIGALLGGLHRDSGAERLFAILLAAVIFVGVTLVGLGPAHGGAGVLAFAIAAWVAWAVVREPQAIESIWPWWGALAVSASLAWRGSA